MKTKRRVLLTPKSGPLQSKSLILEDGTGLSNEEFVGLFEHIEDTVVGISLNQTKRKLLYVNPCYEKIWGKDRESLYKNPSEWFDSVVKEDRKRIEAALKELSLTGKFDEEYRINGKDGKIIWIHGKVYQVKDSTGKVGHLIGFAKNVTADKEKQNQLESLSKREKEVLKLIVSGLKAIEVAKIMCINNRTVSTYKNRIFHKLNISNHADLVRFAIKYNIT